MKKALWKRISAALLAMVMLLAIAACGAEKPADGSQKQTNTASGEFAAQYNDAIESGDMAAAEEIQKEATKKASNGKVFEDGTEISITVSNHASWPHKDDWKMWQYMSEATGAKLKLSAIPLDDYFTKVNLMMAAPDLLPDLLHITQKKMVDQNANQGALMSFDDNMVYLPDYQKFLESLDPKDKENLLMMRRTADGEIYNAPSWGTEKVNNARAWMYRKDIFEKHGLPVPTTYDEVYEVAKQLKQLYPESFPICFRMGFTGIRNMGAQWKPYQSFDIYYDWEAEKWCYGSFEDTTKEIVAWMHKMVAEKLMPPNIIDITTTNWEEYIISNRGFITLDYIVRIDYFNDIMKGDEEYPDFELAFMAPPAAKDGLNKMTACSVDLSGYAVCNTGDEVRMGNAFKLVNWMYTDEAMELLSWGKEGETYKWTDKKAGKREFILGEGETPRGLYGVGSFGLYQRMDEYAFAESYSDKQVAACEEASQYVEDRINPMWWLSFSDEEDARKSDIDAALGSYSEEWIAKFVSGAEPLSKWDEYVANGQKFNVDEYIEIYSKAFNRVYKADKK